MAENSKQRMRNLAGGMFGDSRAADAPVESTRPTDGAVEFPELSDEQRDRLNALRAAGSGRPRGRRDGQRKEPANRATFIVDRELVRKIRYISLVDTRLYRDIIDDALRRYVDGWEAQNGKIRLKKE